jgi:hypothetical protein
MLKTADISVKLSVFYFDHERGSNFRRNVRIFYNANTIQYLQDFTMKTDPYKSHMCLINDHLSLTETSKTFYEVSILDIYIYIVYELQSNVFVIFVDEEVKMLCKINYLR